MRLAVRVVLVALAMFAVAAATLATLWLLVAPEHLPTIVINGRAFAPGPGDGAHWLAAAVAAFVALLGLTVVLPVVLLGIVALPLLLVLLGLGAGALALAVVVGLALSPLLLVGWLLWRATRPRDATIDR